MIEFMSGKPTLQKILEAIQRTEKRSNYPQAPRKYNCNVIMYEIHRASKKHWLKKKGRHHLRVYRWKKYSLAGHGGAHL